MTLRPLALATALAALLPLQAGATDLMDTWELARLGDPQLSIAESSRLATREGAVQARAAMLPQRSRSARLSRSESEGPASTTRCDPVTGQPVTYTGHTDRQTTTRSHH